MLFSAWWVVVFHRQFDWVYCSILLSLSWLDEGVAWHCIGPFLSWGWGEGVLNFDFEGGRNMCVSCTGYSVQGVSVWDRAVPSRFEWCPEDRRIERVQLGAVICPGDL